MSESLKGKTVLVTGGAKRIGRSISIRLAAEGARVLIHYNGSEREARATAEECGGAPIFRANLESVAEIRKMFAELGPLDGLVNNAARFTRIDPLKIEEADWDFIHSVNLKSVFFCCQAAARIMLSDSSSSAGGHIVNISSLGALRPWTENAHYCSSKAGVVMLTRVLAKAWAPKISVNSVAPGVIPFEETDERIQRFIAATPAGRAGTGDEIAEAVLFFLKSTRFITGQLVAVDGGLSQR
jgi:NAD(P)-dependent dehydrogenase (short-subunit alcohol dehydrogenase family)